MKETLIHLGNTTYTANEAAQKGLARIYWDLSKDLEGNPTPCLSCGDCCDFKKFDHEIRLTHIELLFLINNHGLKRPLGDGVCPYLKEGRCGARVGRALGCRIFFCGADQSRSEGLYEIYLGRIRELALETGPDVYFGELLASLEDARL